MISYTSPATAQGNHAPLEVTSLISIANGPSHSASDTVTSPAGPNFDHDNKASDTVFFATSPATAYCKKATDTVSSSAKPTPAHGKHALDNFTQVSLSLGLQMEPFMHNLAKFSTY